MRECEKRDASEAPQKSRLTTRTTRPVLSRCYYAAFHAGTALLMAHGKPEAEQWQSHDTLINQCITLGTRRNKWFVALRLRGAGDFANSFHRLYNLRREADYGLAAVDRRRAKEALVFVSEFLIAVNDRIP